MIYDHFAAVADRDVVFLGRTRAWDHETAVGLAARFLDEEAFFLLESGTSGPRGMARYSYLGFGRHWVWQLTEAGPRIDWDGRVLQESRQLSDVAAAPPGAGAESLEAESLGAEALGAEALGAEALGAEALGAEARGKAADPLDPLRQVLDLHRSVGVVGLPPSAPDIARVLGSVGYVSYDAAHCFEPTVGVMPPRAIGLPLAQVFLPRYFLVIDHLSHSLTAGVVVCPAAEGTSRQAFEVAAARLTALEERLARPSPLAPLRVSDAPLDYEACAASLPRAQFFEHVERCLEEVRSGEVFQIQIGNRLGRRTAAAPFDVFRHLRNLNPSPYLFFYKFGDDHIFGASPEMMVQVADGRIVHRPIAGTRRRCWDAAEDAAMRRELVESEKERAEHVMLVDLGRNDVGRVAALGSVTVDELMAVEAYSHVFHLVSQVSGQLRDDRDALDALAVSFPNGTVSGAPKIRAMQLINELEPVRREFYAGALGIFGLQGDLNTTLLIRTIHMRHGWASTQASAGVVFDSIAKHEWLETRNKMAACLTAIQNTLPSPMQAMP